MSLLARATQRTLTAPDIQTQAERIWARGGGNNQAWRRKSVAQALGVPAILSAVSLIAGTVGRLSLDAYQNGALVLDRSRVPQMMVRPNPRSTPREFNLRTAFYQATRGEFWWFVAHRDGDGNADALFPVPPWEVTVEANPADRLRPTIRWAGKIIANEDMRHQIYLPDPEDPAGVRGIGPLQLAGAAVSVAVEADTWAGNFFSGSLPSLVGTTKLDLDEIDLKALDAQWLEKANNLPRWMGSDMHLEAPPYDAQKAQLTETRMHSVGEVARLFNIPGPLLEYQMSGQSLVYRNGSDIWTQMQQQCLSPHYLEPMQQEISDLQVRSMTGIYNTWELTKADIKTRYEVYESGITKSGILSVEAAQRMEGLAPGDVNYAPVPFSPPAAVTAIPSQLSSLSTFRCSACNWLLAEEAGPGTSIRCRKCKTLNTTPRRELSEDPALMQARSAAVFADAMMMMANREPPTVTVHSAPITVEAPPPQNITFSEGAFRVDAPPPAEVNVNPEIHVDAPDMSGVADALIAVADRPQPEFHIDAPDMSGVAGAIAAIAERPQPEIRVESPVTVEPAQVTVNIPEQRPITREVKHNKDGKIIQIREVPA